MEGVPCTQDRRENSWINLFEDFKDASSSRLGSSWIQLTRQLTKGIVGEYQIVLREVAYEACVAWTGSPRIYRWVSDERICAMNFAVADSYLIHQGASLSTLLDTDLRIFRKVDGRAILDRQAIHSVQQSRTATYPGDEVEKIITRWVDQQTNRATQSAQLVSYTSNFVKKVPTQRIFVYDGWLARTPLVLRWGSMSEVPLTLIVRNADVIVEWSLYGRHMYLVPDGKVTFVNMNCDMKDVVQGIWMSVWWFITDRIRNDRLSTSNRCADGRLVIDGMAVGPWLDDTFVDHRRAVLTEWFDITEVSQQQKVFDAASVLLKTNPLSRLRLPPGADAFIRQLSVKK